MKTKPTPSMIPLAIVSFIGAVVSFAALSYTGYLLSLSLLAVMVIRAGLKELAAEYQRFKNK